MTRYVVVFNRDRDGYQVPLALYEHGLLEALVTDIYSHPRRGPRLLVGPIERRFAGRTTAGLPAAKVVEVPKAQALQVVERPFKDGGLVKAVIRHQVDQVLSERAAAIANAREAGILAYSRHTPALQAAHEAGPRVSFMFHPHPATVARVLADDAARWPANRPLLAMEEETSGWNGRTVSARDAWRYSDAVLCASSFTRQSLVDDGCPPENIALIPYGAPPASSIPHEASRGKASFLFVGQAVQRKGLHILLQAWREVSPATATLHLVLSPGPMPLGHLPDGVEAVGRLSRHSLGMLYAQSDCLVLPSLVESFGLVIGEAMSHGCHVIGTENTGLRDFDSDGIASTVVRAGEVEALAEAIHATIQAKQRGRLRPSDAVHIARANPWEKFRLSVAEAVGNAT